MDTETTDTILEKPQYTLIYRTSYLTLFTGLCAMYKKKNYMVAFSIFASSIHYWKKPDYSYRRYLDIFTVTTALSYQHYSVYGTKNAIPYYAFMLIGKLLYVYGNYQHSKNNKWKATYAHMGLHVFANIAGLIHCFDST